MTYQSVFEKTNFQHIGLQTEIQNHAVHFGELEEDCSIQ